MKKRYWVFLFALFFLILSGCSCEHEWLPPDCVNPQICGKCNAVGTAALGHDWLDATCTAPQICSRCSATQGEPLAHAYGDWTFGEDRMTKICTACQDEVTTDIDRELQLESFLEGYCISGGSNMKTAVAITARNILQKAETVPPILTLTKTEAARS